MGDTTNAVIMGGRDLTAAEIRAAVAFLRTAGHLQPHILVVTGEGRSTVSLLNAFAQETQLSPPPVMLHVVNELKSVAAIMPSPEELTGMCSKCRGQGKTYRSGKMKICSCQY